MINDSGLADSCWESPTTDSSLKGRFTCSGAGAGAATQGAQESGEVSVPLVSGMASKSKKGSDNERMMAGFH